MADEVYDSMYKVRLMSVASVAQGIGSEDTVIFEVTPQFSENREVEYTTLTPVHMPGGIQVFKNTRPRTFSITAKLISRTPNEATINMLYLQKLRGWTMPYFGASSTSTNQQSSGTDVAATTDNDAQPLDTTAISKRLIASQKRKGTGIELLGAPPDVLYLYAYSSAANVATSEGRAAVYGVNINKVPVVITSLGITYPEDVDYIPTYSNIDPRKSEPFPVKVDVQLSLTETHSPREYETFDLIKYKTGQLGGF